MTALTFKKFQKIAQKRSDSVYPNNDFDAEFYGLALAGECGEVCNIIKKIRRGSKKLTATVRKELGKELADVQSYLALLATALSIDLEEATIDKFNEVSRKFKCQIKL
jgi:NTP pyrophosphatase (non-canonical NTP hydrolase)